MTVQYDNDLKSPHRELFLSVRGILLGITGTEETKKEKVTTYSHNGAGLCHMRTMPHGVDIGFLKGFKMDDKYGLLHGETKRMRVLSLEALLSEELEYYLKEAIDKNS